MRLHLSPIGPDRHGKHYDLLKAAKPEGTTLKIHRAFIAILQPELSEYPHINFPMFVKLPPPFCTK